MRNILLIQFSGSNPRIQWSRRNAKISLRQIQLNYSAQIFLQSPPNCQNNLSERKKCRIEVFGGCRRHLGFPWKTDPASPCCCCKGCINEMEMDPADGSSASSKFLSLFSNQIIFTIFFLAIVNIFLTIFKQIILTKCFFW